MKFSTLIMLLFALPITVAFANVKSDVAAIQKQVEDHEAASQSGYQSMSNYSSGCMSMGAVLAVSLGATHLDVDQVIADANNGDAGSKAANQTTFYHVKALFKLLALGCSAVGVSPDKILLLQNRIAEADQSSGSLYRQIVVYLDGCCNMTALLAAKLGANEADLTSVLNEVKDKNSTAGNVFQESANYLIGFAKMAGFAASARGVPNTTVQPLLSEMHDNEVNSTSFYREESAMWASNLKILSILAIGKE